MEQNDHFGGTVELGAAPASVRALFEEFEEVVNGQMFAFVDEVQAKVDSLATRAVFDDGFEAPITDLQVFPGSGELSFRLVALPARTVPVLTPGTEPKVLPGRDQPIDLHTAEPAR